MAASWSGPQATPAEEKEAAPPAAAGGGGGGGGGEGGGMPPPPAAGGEGGGASMGHGGGVSLADIGKSVLDETTKLYCWGDNGVGQLGSSKGQSTTRYAGHT